MTAPEPLPPRTPAPSDAPPGPDAAVAAAVPHGPPSLPPLSLALLPILVTLGLLALQLFWFKDFTPHIPLMLGLAFTGLVGVLRGQAWMDIREGVFHVIHVSMPSLAVLILVGALIGVWIAAGTVPTLIYYGLNVLNPSIFLAAAMVLCAVVSVSLGTSWGTVGTVGLALMGIGAGFGIPPVWTAGAVVSGSFFGDKVSPLSDTTNLAPAVTGQNVFDHIKNMMPTTIPSMLIALTLYLLAGFVLIEPHEASLGAVTQITARLDQDFKLGLIPLIPALVVLVLALLRKPPLPSLFAGVVLGGLVAIFLQGKGLHEVFAFAQDGYKTETGIAAIDSLLNKGGIQSMMWTISLMLIALGFGGALERTGCLEAIIHALIARVRSFGGVQASAIGAAFATNVVAGDPYISIALPGRMFSPLYRGMGYSTLNLSRAVEEGGTLMSPLIPWNAGGAFVITALGLGVMNGDLGDLMYIPLAFACWMSPLIGIFYAMTGFFSPRASGAERESWAAQGETVMDLRGHVLADTDAADAVIERVTRDPSRPH